MVTVSGQKSKTFRLQFLSMTTQGDSTVFYAFWCLCPVHGEVTVSFHFNLKSGAWIVQWFMHSLATAATWE